MTDFVIERDNNDLNEKVIESIFKYAQFLKQPLKLEMFVPCDDDGNVLQEPKVRFDGGYDIDEAEIYQQAKEKVLFEGFEYMKKASVSDCVWIKDTETRFHIDTKYGTTIEHLVKSKLQLTRSAIKHIGLEI